MLPARCTPWPPASCSQLWMQVPREPWGYTVKGRASLRDREDVSPPPLNPWGACWLQRGEGKDRVAAVLGAAVLGAAVLSRLSSASPSLSHPLPSHTFHPSDVELGSPSTQAEEQEVSAIRQLGDCRRTWCNSPRSQCRSAPQLCSHILHSLQPPGIKDRPGPSPADGPRWELVTRAVPSVELSGWAELLQLKSL